MESGGQPRRRLHAAVRRDHFDLVTVGHAMSRRRFGMNFNAIAPNGLGDRIGQLLEPRNVRVAAVEELRGGVGDKRQR